jgi:hypothetical protein
MHKTAVNAINDTRMDTDRQVNLFVKATRMIRFLIHTNLPNCIQNQVALNDFAEVVNQMFRMFVWALNNNKYELSAEAHIALSMFAANGDSLGLNDKTTAISSYAYFGLIRGLESMVPFFGFTSNIMIPEDTDKNLRPYVSQELKLSAIRIMEHIIIKSDYDIIMSKKFTTAKAVQFFLEGIKDTSGPPRNLVAFKTMYLLQQQHALLLDNQELFVDHIIPLTKWLSHFD